MKSWFLLCAISLCACAHQPERSIASSDAFQFKHRAYIAPDELRTQDLNVLAEAIVSRLHKQCDVPRSHGESGSPVGKDMTILMMVHSQSISMLQQFGIPNQHISRVTSGSDAPKARYIAEQELSMLRFPYSSKVRELLPKYFTFSIKGQQFGNTELPTQYGDIVLVFKDSIKSRTTWTYMDSLGTPFADFGWRTPELFPPRTPLYVRPASDTTTCVRYCETQTWGSLTLADVDHILVASATVPEGLRGLGIPVYHWQEDSTANQLVDYREDATPLLTGPGAQPPASLSLADIRAQLTAQKDHWVMSHILSSKEYGLLPPEEILVRLTDPSLDKGGQPFVSSDSWSNAREIQPNEWSAEEKLVAELAVREKTPPVLAKLQESTKSHDPLVRAQAYYGLSEQSAALFKAELLRCFTDENELVVLDCVAYSADFWGHDADIDKAIVAVQTKWGSAVMVRDWISRLKNDKLCQF